MMELPVSQQIGQMMQMILCGWLIMLSGHEKQMLSKTGRWSYRKRAAGDFLFCIFWAVCLWLILLQVSGGMVRNYIALGLAGGMMVYKWLFRRYMERFCRLLANVILFVWCWMWRILLWPYRLLRRMFAPWTERARKFLHEKQEFNTAGENIIENENNF